MFRYTVAGGATKININAAGSSSPTRLAVADGALYFAAARVPFDYEPFRYTAETGPVEIAIDPDGFSSPAEFTEYDGAVYFRATEANFDTELYRHSVDGGLAKINVSVGGDDGGGGGSTPAGLTVYDGALYFRGTDADGVLGLYRYTVTDGPVRAAEVTPVGAGGPIQFQEYEGALYFSAYDSGTNETRLYRYVARATDSDDSGPDASSWPVSGPWPNPTADRATVALHLDTPFEVTAEVVDVLGRRVALVEAGESEVTVDLARVPAGVYLVRLVAGDRVVVRSLTVAR